MANERITIIHGDAADHGRPCDLLMTDPPYELSGAALHRVLFRYEADHLVMLTTMRQLIGLLDASDWRLQFDFVIDGVAPKKSRSYRQPHYQHQTGVYLTRNGAASRFDRRLWQRSDVFEANGYWPTILHAPRDTHSDTGFAKNEQAMIDLLGSFECEDVCDPFAGGGSTGIAAFQHDRRCVLVEKDAETFAALRANARFLMSAYGLEIIE